MDVCEIGRTKEPNRSTCPGENSKGTVVMRAESVLDRANKSSDGGCLDSYGRRVTESGFWLKGLG